MSFSDSMQSMKKFDINDLDINNAGIWPAPIKLIVVLILSGVVFGCGYWFFVKDMFTTLDTVRGQEVELKEQYESKAHQVVHLATYKQQMIEMEETFGALLRQLPSDTEVPGLLEDITNTALGSGLELKLIALKTESQKDFYIELPIDIKVSGTYHELAAFVSSVSGLPRIVTLHDFSIKPVQDKSKEGDLSGELDMEILAKTYRYRAGE